MNIVDGMNHEEQEGNIAVSTSSYFIVLSFDGIQPYLCAIDTAPPLFHISVWDVRGLT